MNSEMVLFAGAGISFEEPSRVPVAIPVVEAIVRAIAPSAKIAQDLMPYLRAGRAGEQHAGDYLRFEVLLEIVHDFADADLNVLGFIDEFQAFNPLHQIFAAQAVSGAAIVTTNFDSLIERALLDLGAVPLTLCADADFAATAPVLPPGSTPIYKLHGSLKRHNGAASIATPETLGATIAAIARGTDGRRLPEPKHSFFRNLVRGRAMLVAGYSGSDDLDIVPTFEELEPNSILWLHHDSRSELPEKDITAAEHGRISSLSSNRRSARDRMFFHYLSERPGVLTILRTHTLRFFLRRFGAPRPPPTEAAAPTWEWFEQFLKTWRGRFVADRCDRYAIVGEIWFRLSRMRKANTLFRRACSHLNPINPPPHAARIIITAARMREGIGDYNGALRLLQQVEDLGLKKLVASDLARYWHERGYIEYQLRHLDSALHCFGKALRIALRKPTQEDRIAYCFQDSGIVHQDLGHLAKADRRFARAAAIDEASGNLRHASWARYQRGICRYYLADPKEAREQFRYAREIASRLADLNHMGNVEHGMALVEFLEGRLPSSIRRCRSSMRYSRQTGQTAFDGMDWQQIGVCFLEARRLPAARRCFEHAARRYRNAKDTVTPAELATYTALLELEAANVPAARRNALRAVRLARYSQMPEYQIRADFILGLVRWVETRSERNCQAMTNALLDAKRAQLLVLALDFAYQAVRVGLHASPLAEWVEAYSWSAKLYAELGNSKRAEAMTVWVL
jgi:tetratricopeptide (TPR) repeat protein